MRVGDFTDIYIVGAGGFGREVFAWAQHVAAAQGWRILGFLDDNPQALAGMTYPVPPPLPIDAFEPKPRVGVIIAIGNVAIKREVVRRLRERGAAFARLVHPSVVIGHNVTLGEGVVLCPGVILGSDLEVGDFAMLNMGVTVGHDARVGPYCVLSAHCDVTGGAILEAGVFMGSRASVLPQQRVGTGARVGAGSVVIQEVAPHTSVFGVPAREI